MTTHLGCTVKHSALAQRRKNTTIGCTVDVLKRIRNPISMLDGAMRGEMSSGGIPALHGMSYFSAVGVHHWVQHSASGVPCCGDSMPVLFQHGAGAQVESTIEIRRIN